jgi:BirA family biotin operon repressor/biotin-[acetyl-CoA-carboxylase] ligase
MADGLNALPTTCDLPPGWQLETLASTDSTNAELKRRLAASAGHAEGLILCADVQTAGRGRQGRVWESPRGNVYASFLLAVDNKATASQVGFVAVVSVIDALIQVARLPLRCKWPNDVLLDGRKVCGILPELVTDQGGRDWIVLGIGINLRPVTVPNAAYPVTSLADHGISVSAEAVVRILSQELAHRLGQWRNDGFAPISQAWQAAGPVPGAPIAVRLPDSGADVVNGRFRALDTDGGLVIDVNGAVRRILAGEVLFAREHDQEPERRAGAG